MNNQSEEAVSAFIEQMGLSSEADGLPRIAGRMWGFFIIHGGPVSFAELADRLKVSRGSISTNARILRDLGIIERITLPGDRQDYYQLADEPYTRMLQGYMGRMQRMCINANKVREALPAERGDAKKRLAEMARFYNAAVTVTGQLIKELESDK